MVIKLKAVMVYDTDDKHNDSPGRKGLIYSDIYSFDTAIFGNSREDMDKHITEDMRLVAGGGYDDNHIKNVTLQIFKYY